MSLQILFCHPDPHRALPFHSTIYQITSINFIFVLILPFPSRWQINPDCLRLLQPAQGIIKRIMSVSLCVILEVSPEVHLEKNLHKKIFHVITIYVKQTEDLWFNQSWHLVFSVL